MFNERPKRKFGFFETPSSSLPIHNTSSYGVDGKFSFVPGYRFYTNFKSEDIDIYEGIAKRLNVDVIILNQGRDCLGRIVPSLYACYVHKKDYLSFPINKWLEIWEELRIKKYGKAI